MVIGARIDEAHCLGMGVYWWCMIAGVSAGDMHPEL